MALTFQDFPTGGGLYHIPNTGNLTFLWGPGSGSQHIFIGRGGEVICPPVCAATPEFIEVCTNLKSSMRRSNSRRGGGGGYSGWSDPKFQTPSREVPILLGLGGGVFWTGQI